MSGIEESSEVQPQNTEPDYELDDDCAVTTYDDTMKKLDETESFHKLRVTVKPKLNSYVMLKLKDGQSLNAKILSKQPKKSSKYGNWMNILPDGTEIPSSVNWDEIKEWKQLPDQEKVVLLTATEEMSQEVIDAKDREIQNLRDNDVFEIVEHQKQPLISCTVSGF